MAMSVVMQVWNNASNGRRIGVVVAAICVIAATVAGFFWLMKEQDDVLFSGLEARDAAAVVRELEQLKIDYRLEDGGTTIMVPIEDVHSTRLKLMGSGVPLSGGVGFEIFDDSDFGMTEFAQRINLQRALEGELTRTIMALDEIKYARVHLVMPENGLFKQSSREPTASVALFLKDGRTIGNDKIMGVQRLVAAAVPELSAEQVTVSDQNGSTLSKITATEAGVGAISERLQKKAEVEQYLTGKAVEVLARAFGSNQALVSVDVALNFNQSQTTREEVLAPPKGSSEGVVRRRESRSGNEAEKAAAGRNVSTEVEYRLGREVEQIVELPGQIKRISVGVIIPDTTEQGRYEEIKHLVAMAVGLDESRGDVIGVYSAAPLVQAASGSANVGAGQPGGNEPVRAVSMDGKNIAVPDAVYGNTQPVEQMGFSAWIISQFQQKTEKVIGLAAALLLSVLLLVFVVVKLSRRESAERRILSSDEREHVLTQIRGWLELESQHSSNDVKDSRAAQ